MELQDKIQLKFVPDPDLCTASFEKLMDQVQNILPHRNPIGIKRVMPLPVLISFLLSVRLKEIKG